MSPKHRGGNKKHPEGGKGGRPISLTEEVERRILAAIRRGNYIETACGLGGVHTDTYHDWMRRAKKGEQPFKDFRDAIELALAEGEDHDLKRIDKAADKIWMAAAWRLERRMPDKYGRRDTTRFALPGGEEGGGSLTVRFVKSPKKE